MPQFVVVCKQECNLSTDIIVSPCALTQARVPINAAPQRCVTHEFFMFFYACGIENPTDFPLRFGGLPVGFFRFEMSAHKPFSIYGYSFQNEPGFQRDGDSFGSESSNRGEEHPVGWGFQRGQSTLGSGFQRRQSCLGRKNPMKPAVSWHTTFLEKSSVLYLWRPWVAERGCSGQDKRFQPATERADFGAPRAEIQDLPRGKIRLFGCR